MNMKTIKTIAGGLALFFLFVQQTPAARAQTQNSRARQFYESAVKEKDLEKRIAALNKAVAADPNFAEALYNLALAHKEKQEYGLVERYLLKANSARPDETNGDLKVAILYELAAAYNRQGKTKNFEETLRLAKGLAADAQRGATISFELGRFLYQQGRYDEALLELQEGQRLYPARRDYFANLIRLTQTAQETKQLYTAVERATAKGRLEEARALLFESKQKNPADKNVEARLAELDSRLAAEAGARKLATLYEQAQQYEADGNFALAIASYEKLLQQAGDYKNANTRLQNLRLQLEQKKLNDELEAQYAIGKEALKARDWLAAIAAFEKVRRLNPDYRDVTTLMTAIEKRVQSPGETLVAEETPAAHLDSLYAGAAAAFANKDWPQAVVRFEKLQALQPDYRDVIERLGEARANPGVPAATVAVVEAPANGNVIFYVGGFMALIALPALGFIVWSPAGRARLQVLRGNYAAAAQTYERFLARHPERLRFYPLLAKIYLLQGRRDQLATRVYKTILQLNLATDQRDEINAIVAQNFLTEGRAGVDAIHILEQALKVEQRRGRN